MSGMIVSELHELSPFSKVGIEVGDIITKVDGLDINSPAEMLYRMSVAGIGTKGRYFFLTKGLTRTKKLIWLKMPNSNVKDIVLGPKLIFPELHISELTPEFQSKFGLPFSSKGLIVLDTGRIVGRLGLRSGDLLQEINGKPVETIEEAISAIGSIKSNGSITINRSGRRIALRFRL